MFPIFFCYCCRFTSTVPVRACFICQIFWSEQDAMGSVSDLIVREWTLAHDDISSAPTFAFPSQKYSRRIFLFSNVTPPFKISAVDRPLNLELCKTWHLFSFSLKENPGNDPGPPNLEESDHVPAALFTIGEGYLMSKHFEITLVQFSKAFAVWSLWKSRGWLTSSSSSP